MRALHAGGTISRLRAPIASLHVQAETADGAVLRREHLHVPIQARVDAAAAELRLHVDALDPPEVAVSPVAPLFGDHQRGDQLAAELRHRVEARVGPAQKSAHAGADDLRHQYLALGLERHRAVERDERRGVAPRGLANL